MKKLLMILALMVVPAWAMAADIDGDTDTVNNALDISKGGTDATTAENARTNLGVPATAVTLAGSCTVGPCLDGTSDGGDLIKLYGPGGFWTAVQAGNAAANRSWRLPIAAAPAAGSVLLMTMDEYGQMAFLAACPNDEDTLEWDTTTTRFVCKTLPTITTQDDNLTSGEGNIPTSAYILQFDSDGDGDMTDETWWSKIASAAAAVVDAVGEIAVDLTSDQLVFYGGAKRVVPYRFQENFAVKTPVDADDFLIFKVQQSITITDVHVIAQGGTSISVDVQECDSAGANCATVDAAITADTDGAEDDGTLSNGTIDAGDWVKVVLGAPSGTVNYLAGSIYYTITAD